jgi:predicted nuclease of predicted toxin-antitoxin system
MAAFLVDESCPRAVAEALVQAGYDSRYAAETHRRATDVDLIALAQAENRILVTEDFDFGDLLIRDQFRAPGAIVLFLPRSSPQERARRLVSVLAAPGFEPASRLTIISARRVRQRALPVA